MLSVEFLYCYAQRRYAERHYAKCHYAKCHYAECRYAECHDVLFLVYCNATVDILIHLNGE
jgi:hypothetical protein